MDLVERRFYERDATMIGLLEEEQPKKIVQIDDETIAKRISRQKLMHWRFFFFAEKFIEFNKDVIGVLTDQMHERLKTKAPRLKPLTQQQIDEGFVKRPALTLERAVKRGMSDLMKRKKKNENESMAEMLKGFSNAAHHKVYLQIKFCKLKKEPGGKFRHDTTQYQRIMLKNQGELWTSKLEKSTGTEFNETVQEPVHKDTIHYYEIEKDDPTVTPVSIFPIHKYGCWSFFADE